LPDKELSINKLIGSLAIYNYLLKGTFLTKTALNAVTDSKCLLLLLSYAFVYQQLTISICSYVLTITCSGNSKNSMQHGWLV